MRRIVQLFTLVLAAALLVVPAARSASSDMVVSQVFAGGGNANAPYTNDFVELFNRGTATVDLSTWSIQYATGSGTTWQVTPLSGSVPAGGHYLVQLASAAAIGASLPTPDATGTSNLAVSGGKVSLVHSATALTCGGSAGSCSADSSVVDLVGVRLRNRLRGRLRRSGNRQYDRGSADGRWVHGLRRELERLLRGGADAAQLGRRRRALLQRLASSSVGVAKRRRRPRHSVGPLDRAGAAGHQLRECFTGQDARAGLGAGDRLEQSPRRVRAHRPPLSLRSVRPAAWPLGSSAERGPARQRAGQWRYGGDSDRPGARPAYRDDVHSEHCGRRCLGDQRRVRLPAACGRAGSLHRHRYLHGDRAMIGLSCRSLVVSLVLALVPASAGASAGPSPSRSPRRPPE